EVHCFLLRKNLHLRPKRIIVDEVEPAGHEPDPELMFAGCLHANLAGDGCSLAGSQALLLEAEEPGPGAGMVAAGVVRGDAQMECSRRLLYADLPACLALIIDVA